MSSSPPFHFVGGTTREKLQISVKLIKKGTNSKQTLGNHSLCQKSLFQKIIGGLLCKKYPRRFVVVPMELLMNPKASGMTSGSVRG